MVAKASRQKYNFLAALLTQVEDACAAGDELYAEFADMVCRVGGAEQAEALLDLEKRMKNAERTYDGLNKWLAQLELALEELDDDGSEGFGEEPVEDDDGDDDDELEGVETSMGSPLPTDGRLAAGVGGARRPASRRDLKERIGLGTRKA